ncbi:hypothetical protein [Flectobacillus rivi]|uniref:DUF4131 domain-containing protein n=1 Tax=Flectobacillus rivi TaxID=2984209 RepID=A0ABT6Z3A4_9BACT|nr:hypothetical protein [Flectobacillus rivi]MDI9875081.1 hypothetical protein [Flectobacillus rivi]
MKHLNKLSTLHLGLLLVFVCNFLLHFSTYRLNASLSYILNLGLYSSGIILFVLHVKPLRAITFYYMFYLVGGLIFILLNTLKSAYVYLLATVFLFPFFQDSLTSQYGNLNLYHRKKGIVKHRFLYEVAEKKYLIFEKVHGRVRDYGRLATGEGKLSLTKNGLQYQFQITTASGIKKDTTELLILEK